MCVVMCVCGLGGMVCVHGRVVRGMCVPVCLCVGMSVTRTPSTVRGPH